jgi:HTH-type transcriptional regulator, sugar sensing transcriptional regulator
MITERELGLLGLTFKESRLYSSALPIGQFSVAEIATASGLKRPTCYLILEELIKKGLILIVPETTKQLYKAESPDVLIRQAEHSLSLARRIVPSLDALYSSSKSQPIVRFYNGQKGIRNIYEETLAKGIKEYKYIGSSKELIEMAGADYIQDYIKRRALKKHVSVKSIRMRGHEIQEDIYTDSKKLLREIRYAPDGFYLPYTIFLYGKKVAFISTGKDSFGLVVESQGMVDTISGLFEALWRLSTPSDNPTV